MLHSRNNDSMNPFSRTLKLEAWGFEGALAWFFFKCHAVRTRISVLPGAIPNNFFSVPTGTM
jgi:hypothetical protein